MFRESELDNGAAECGICTETYTNVNECEKKVRIMNTAVVLVSQFWDVNMLGVMNVNFKQ